MSRVAVTGASGFIGTHLVDRLRRNGHSVRPLRRRDANFADTAPVSPVLFAETDAVVHLAGIAHTRGAPAEHLHAVNAEGARRAAESAATAGVRRFVLVSSALVHGDRSGNGPLTETSPLRPETAYAESKLAGERAARAVGAAHGMSVCVIRPPLVYAPDASGNIARLAAWARQGRPLPAATRHNRRSLIGVNNLAALLAQAATDSRAEDRTFLVSDGTTRSTADLYEDLCRQHGTQAWYVPVPASLIRMMLVALGRGREATALFENFEIGPEAVGEALGWEALQP